MKTVISMLTFLIMFCNLSAQTARELLDKVNSTYQNASTYYVKFEFKDGNGSEIETGELFASKDKYNLSFMDIEQMYDGKSLYTISKDDKEITISKPADDDLLTPTKVLRMYKEGYKLTLETTEKTEGKNLQNIRLTPDKKGDFNYIIVSVDTKTNTLYRYKEFLSNGNIRTITLKDYMENLIIPGALFKFDKSKYEKDGYIVTQL